MRPAAAARLVYLGLALPGVGWAQLPLPQVADTPGFQIATADGLVDEARTLTQSLVKTLEQRRSSPPAGSRDDPSVQRLVELYDEEIKALEEALTTAEKALDQAQTPPGPGSTEPVELGVVLQALESRDSLHQQAEIRGHLAERLLAVTVSEPPVPGPAAPLLERIDHQSWRVQEAQGRRARAMALQTAVESRRAQRAYDRLRARLEVGPTDVEAAQRQLEKTRTEVDTARASLARDREVLGRDLTAEPRRSEERIGDDVSAVEASRRRARDLSLARYDLIARRDERLRTRLLHAQARLRVTEALASGRPPELLPEQMGEVEAGLARVAEHAAAVQLTLSGLQRDEPEGTRARRVWTQHREVLQQTQVILQENENQLRAIQRLQSLGSSAPPLWDPVLGFWPTVALSALLLILIYVLIRWVGPRLQAWISNRRSAMGHIASESTRDQLETITTLLWPLAVLGSGATLLLWYLWGLSLGPIEVLRIVDRPLFYIEETPFSPFSFIQLLLVLWVTYVLARSIRRFLNQRMLKPIGLDAGQSNAIATFVYYLAQLTGLIVGLNLVGIGFSSLAVVLGVLGLGIGFGLRTITENFISGLIILAERPIQVGDFIDLDGKVEGQVRSIQARSTTVQTRDNISVIIPNSDFVLKPVTNWSHGDPKVRVAVKVGVAYGSDCDLVRRTLIEVAGRHGQVLRKPAPEVQFREFGDSTLDFLLLVWVDEQLHRFRIASDLHFAIDKAFRKVGIVIAFPQLDVHLSSVSTEFQKAVRNLNFPNEPIESPVGDSSPTVQIPTSRSRIRDATTQLSELPTASDKSEPEPSS